MSCIVKSFPGTKGFRSKYIKYMDGRIWKLEPGTDFKNAGNVRSACAILARKMGKKCKSRVVENFLYLQAK